MEIHSKPASKNANECAVGSWEQGNTSNSSGHCMVCNQTNQMGMLYMTNPMRHQKNSVMNECQYNGGSNNSFGHGKFSPVYLPRCPLAVMGRAATHIPAPQRSGSNGKLCDDFKGKVTDLKDPRR